MADSNLIAELAKDAHRRVCEVCHTMLTVEHAVKYIESVTNEHIGETSDLGFTATDKACSWANLARIDIAKARERYNGEDDTPYTYGSDDEREKRMAAYIDMLKAVYGDDLEAITGLSKNKLDGKTELTASDYFDLAQVTEISIDWLFGMEVA